MDVGAAFKTLVADHLNVPVDKVTEDATFIKDLGADSLDRVELVMITEEYFDLEISDEQAESISTVGEAITALKGVL